MAGEIRLRLIDTRPNTIRDLEAALDAAGITRDILSGRGSEAISPKADWKHAETTCAWTADVVEKWRTVDEPFKSSRHGWLIYNAVRLACMRRYGCLTLESEANARLVLKERFEWLLANTGDDYREPHENEVLDCLNWGIETAETKTDEEVSAELDDHTHDVMPPATEAMLDRWRATLPDRKPAPEFTIRSAAELTPKRVEHLWQDEMVLNALNLISGPQGEGKSTIATWLAAEITKGELEGALLGKPSEVVYVSFEEDPESTVLGRLIAMEADLAKVHFVFEGAGEDGDELVNLARSVEVLEKVLVQKPNTRAVIIDPIIEGLSGTNTDSETEVRKHLKRLRNLCKRYSITVILVTHWNKKEQAGIRQRIMGSTAFSSVPRTNYAVIPDYEDQEDKRRYLGCFKENASPEARSRRYPYRLVKQYLTHNGIEIEAPRIEWEPVESGGIEDYYNAYSAHSKTVTIKSPTSEQTEREKMNEEIARFIKREIEQSDLVVESGKHKGRKYVLSKQTQDLVINKGLVKNVHADKYQREAISKACKSYGIDKSPVGVGGSWVYMIDNAFWSLRDSI